MAEPCVRTVLLLALAGALGACGSMDDEFASASPAGGPPPEGFATEMVDAHDAVRAGARPAPTPPLAPLSWSDGVAATAQALADGCTYGHNPRLRELSLGENIAATAPPGSHTTAEIVGLWAAEAEFYDLETNTCDAANPENEPHTCGHYTQIVWRRTTIVGCGKRTCTTGSPFGSEAPRWDFWVCNYAPPGNFVGERPY